MAVWQNKLEAGLRATLVNDATVKGHVKARSFVGELAGLKRRDFPMITFVIQGSSGDFGAYSGTFRVWVWTGIDARTLGRTIYKAVEDVLSHQRVVSDNFAFIPESNGDAVTTYIKDDELYRTTGTFRFHGFQLS